ncbi:exonuclease [Gordonia phage Lysidious]|nr:exonuclease [Gordonia phage Lysidious]
MAVNIAPGSPEWMRTITPSKVAAILGISRYQSQFALWHQMAGHTPAEEPKDEFTAGHAFEPALAYLWKSENQGWRLSPGEVQIARTDLGFATFATIDRRATRGRARRVVEFKTARSLEDWGDEFTDQAPTDYVAQVQWQMHVTRFTSAPAHLMVMGPFFRWHTYEIEYQPELCAAIEDRCRSWVSSLDAGVEPELDDSVATYDCVRQLHPDIDPDAEVDVSPAVAAEYLAADTEYKAADKRLRGAKSQLLNVMKRARLAHCGDVKVATRSPHARGGVALKRNAKADAESVTGVSAA